jgi:hypothetical protein
MQLFAKIVGPLYLLYLYCLFRLRKHADNILYILLPSLTGNVSKKVYINILIINFARLFLPPGWYPPAGTTDQVQGPPTGTRRNSHGRTRSTGTPAGMFMSPTGPSARTPARP